MRHRTRRFANRRAREAHRATVDASHRLYYGRGVATWGDTWWLGVKVRKSPLDLWVYQEIIHETQPDLVVETGTAEQFLLTVNPGRYLRRTYY